MATTLLPGAVAAPIPDDDFALERHGVWKRFRRHKLALVGAVVIVLITLVAVLARWLPIADPNYIDQVNWQGTPLAPGVAHHLLGTDENGRDLVARLIFGAQISLTVAFFAVLMELTIGTVVGAFAGYYGGWTDYALMRLTDVFLSIPLLPLLGFGIQPPTASWGNMLANAESNMAIAPWVAIFPGLCILVTVLAINYLGDGLRDALDPNMK